MADPTVGNVLDDARVLLNDANGNIYPNSVLLPYIKIAWDELALELATRSIPVLKEVSADIDVDANVNDVAGPADMIAPIKLQEKPKGQTDEYYVDMYQRWWEGSELAPTAYIQYWSFREQRFYFAPHTNDQQVRIFYIKDLSVIADANSQLDVHHCKTVLAKRTAGLAARYAGSNPTRADALDEEAAYFLRLLLNRQIQSTQSMPVRRRGYPRYRHSGRS